MAHSNKENEVSQKKLDETCYDFLSKNYSDQFQILLNNEDALSSVSVEYLHFFEECPDAAELLLKSPSQLLEHLDSAAKRVLADTCVALQYENSYCNSFATGRDNFTTKRKLHVRVHSLPVCAELTRTEFPSSQESGNFLCIIGTVVRAGPLKLLEYSKSFQCNRCKMFIDILAPASRYHTFPRFAECPNMCPNAKVAPVADEKSKQAENHSKFKDYQEIKLQEQIYKMDFGVVPNIISVVLEDDLVSSCKPGDDVQITGYLFLRWKPFKVGYPADSELVFKANHVQVNNDQKSSVLISNDMANFVADFWNLHKLNPFRGRNFIVQSFCPQIYGLYVVKLAMCMVLAGGVVKEHEGSRTRGESHLLLVGDPGTGKSQLLKYASKISPRSLMTTGIGTSSAGLTASAVQENGEWHLEAGALVLADGGVCCIDEFSCIKEHDRISIHEAMEQQTISVAKAGMVVKLPTRVTIIAATNPKGKYDADQPLTINVGLASPLLSRFDIVIVLADAQSSEWDNFIVDFVLEGRESFENAMKSSQTLWRMNQLRAYFVMIKEFEPEMTPDANEVISRYYQFQRSLEDRNTARTTVRLFESLRRLSEGHARLMFRNQVLIHDAITAISVLQSSTYASLLEVPNLLHTSFPIDPVEEYKQQAQSILSRLDLGHLWEKEREQINLLAQGSAPLF